MWRWTRDEACSAAAVRLHPAPSWPLRGAAGLFVSAFALVGRNPVAQPLMPHAPAAWLVDNSSLPFEQIAEFCGLHILEVQAIADDTAATKLTGRDPIRAGELNQEEIDRGQADSNYKLKIQKEPDQ